MWTRNSRGRYMPVSLAVLICFSLMSFTAAAQAPKSSAKIVYVGHSLIDYGMPEMVSALANSLSGLSIERAVQAFPGTGIAANWGNCRASTFQGLYPPLEFACDSIAAGSPTGLYDTLVLTQVNNPIIYPDPTDFGTTPQDYERFLNELLTRNSNGRGYFFTQWESLNSPWHQGQDWTTRVAAETSHIQAIATRINELSLSLRGRTTNVAVIPGSIALRDVILAAEAGQFPGIAGRGDLFIDDVHMTNLGNYIIACAVFSSIYERSAEGATGRTLNRWGTVMTDLSQDLALRIQRSVWNTVSQFRGWTTPAVRPKAPSSFSVS
jgi:hypothetical protein